MGEALLRAVDAVTTHEVLKRLVEGEQEKHPLAGSLRSEEGPVVVVEGVLVFPRRNG